MAVDVAPPVPADHGDRRAPDPGPAAGRSPSQQPSGDGTAAAVRARATRVLPATTLALLLLAGWEVAVRALGVPAYLLPAPSAVARALVELRATLPAHTLATVVTATGGLVLAAVAGVGLAVAIRSVSLVRRVLYPLLVVSQTIPMVVLAPLLVVWFGFGIGPKIGVVALVAFFPVVVSTVDGLDNAEPDLVDVVVSMGATRAALLRHVLLPAALPGFFAGLAIAATYAMVGAVIAEWMGASSGLGLLITRSAASFRVDRVFAGVAVVAAVSVALFAVVRLLARLAMPWTAPARRRRRARRCGGGAMTPRALGGLALVAVLAACSGGTGTEQAPGALRPVTVMLNWTPNTHHAGIYAARAQGWYAEEGLDVEIVEPAGGGADQVVGAGRADFGLSQAESLLPAREQGVPVVSIATVLPTNDSALMTLGDEGIARPRDLVGKTYGGYGGPLETALVRRLVTCDGGDPDGVAFVEVGDVDYLGGLEQDRFDFAWVFNGWDVIAAREVAGADIATLPFAGQLDCIPDWYTPIVITSEQTATEDPDLVRAFLAATRRGYALADTDPGAAAEALLGAAELDAELVAASAEYHAGRYAADGQAWGVQKAEVWEGFAAFLVEAGLLEGTVEVDEAFTDAFLPR